MSWTDEIAELERRRGLMAGMGGPVGIAKQRERGKLTARERIAALIDPGSFSEHLSLVGSGTYENEKLAEFVPKGAVDGTAKIDGRKVFLIGSDFTVRGGSASSSGGLGQEMSTAERALQWRLPLIRLLDASGGSVKSFETLGRTYLPDGNIWTKTDVALLSQSPVVSAVLGSVAGLPAIQVPLSHFSVMVKDIGQMFPGGPPVVKASLGYDITKEDLGGDKVHSKTGSLDNIAENETEAFDMIRRFLSYLPSSISELPPRGSTEDPVDRVEEDLVDLIPKNRRIAFDARRLIDAVVDKGSFFEIAPKYGRPRIVGLARLNGWPVGIMANNPKISGGATDVAAGSKASRLIQLCNTFHLPLISLADEPGFQVGLESEKQGIERAGAHLVSHVNLSSMPWCTVVVGRLFGVGGQCHHRASGMFRRYAWPTALWGSMHIAGGAAAAYKREIESAEDPEAKRLEIEARLNAVASPFRTAEATGQDIIDPRETRRVLCDFVDDAQRIIVQQLGPCGVPYIP